MSVRVVNVLQNVHSRNEFHVPYVQPHNNCNSNCAQDAAGEIEWSSRKYLPHNHSMAMNDGVALHNAYLWLLDATLGRRPLINLIGENFNFLCNGLKVRVERFVRMLSAELSLRINLIRLGSDASFNQRLSLSKYSLMPHNHLNRIWSTFTWVKFIKMILKVGRYRLKDINFQIS